MLPIIRLVLSFMLLEQYRRLLTDIYRFRSHVDVHIQSVLRSKELQYLHATRCPFLYQRSARASTTLIYRMRGHHSVKHKNKAAVHQHLRRRALSRSTSNGDRGRCNLLHSLFSRSYAVYTLRPLSMRCRQRVGTEEGFSVSRTGCSRSYPR